MDLEVFTNDSRAAFFPAPESFGNQAVVARQLFTDQRGYIAELFAEAVNRNALDPGGDGRGYRTTSQHAQGLRRPGS